MLLNGKEAAFIQQRIFFSFNRKGKPVKSCLSLCELNILHQAKYTTSILTLANFENSQGSGWFCAYRSLQAEAMRQVE